MTDFFDSLDAARERAGFAPSLGSGAEGGAAKAEDSTEKVAPACECPTDDYCPRCHPRWYAKWRAAQAECCCESSPPEFGGNLPDRECPLHGERITPPAECDGCLCPTEHDGDYGSSGHAGPCPPHTCATPPAEDPNGGAR